MLEVKRSKKNYKIFIIGVGGTGSNLISPLARLINFSNKEDKIIIVDGDVYETKNQKNQNIGVKQIGMAKSKAMSDLVSSKYKNVDISYIDEYITNKEMIISALDDNNYINIIVGCVDNNSTRKILHDVFYSNKVNNLIYIDSGNGTEEREGQIIIGYKINGSIKYRPVGDYIPDILEDNDTVEKATSCAATANEKPQNIATNFMAASILFNVLNNILSFEQITNNKIFFNCESCSVESY